MKQNQVQQKAIRLGTHGENYGSWMSNPVFYVIGALLALSVVLAVLSFAVFHITALGVVFVIAAVILLALLLWCAWIRRQYAFGGGGMMERSIRSSSPIWILTGRDNFWRLDAAPAH